MELLHQIKGLPVLVVGDVLLDEYLGGDCSRLSPEAPVPIVQVNQSSQRYVLGGAANTAANVASLDGRPLLIGLVGRDSTGDVLRQLCAAGGIEFLPIEDGRPTLRKTRVISGRQQLLRLDYEDAQDISPDTADAVLRRFRQCLPKVAAIVLSDYAKGLLTCSLTQAMINEAHAAGLEVIVDPRPAHLSHYEHCDYITPNWRESQELLGRPLTEPTLPEIETTGLALRQRLGCHIVLTLGPQGMAVFERDNGHWFRLPTVAREVFDVSGAGDTVVAALALGRAAGADLETAAKLANLAAGVVVGKLGTATVTADEIIRNHASASRLIDRKGLRTLSQSLKARGRVIVTVNGSFDLLHSGHLHIIDEAKRQGDTLIVGLNSDASLRRYKGPDRPIRPQQERATMLLALRAVDYVHVFDEVDPIAFLEEVRPDVHVNGAEYGFECIEAPTVRAHGGRLHLVSRIADFSTSGILATLRAGIV